MPRVVLVLLLAASVATWTARLRWQTPTRRQASAAFPVVMCDGDGDSVDDGGSVGAGDGDSGGDGGGGGGDDDRSLQASLRRAAAAKLGASVDSMMPSADLAWSSAGSSKMAAALEEGRRATQHTLCSVDAVHCAVHCAGRPLEFRHAVPILHTHLGASREAAHATRTCASRYAYMRQPT